MNFTLKQLEYFRALATLGNFGRAAEASNISQPALSVQIRTLEESLGGRLIERQSRASVLTPLGREVLTRQREEGPQRVLRGIVATGRGIPRPHMRVMLTADVPVGEVTSGTFSPTLRKGVGLALVAATVAADAEVSVDVRGRREVFALTKPPFVDPSVRES